MADEGIPRREGIAVRFGDVGSKAGAMGIVSLGKLRRLLCGA